MEFIPATLTWALFENGGLVDTFRAFRAGDKGRDLIITQNVFVENVLPGGVLRPFTEKEMTHYRAPYLDPPTREPLYIWPNEVPIEKEPADVFAVTDAYHAWLVQDERVPKLLFYANPGAIIGEELAGWYKSHLKNLRSVDIGEGRHYLQEDHPHEIGMELGKWMREVVGV